MAPGRVSVAPGIVTEYNGRALLLNEWARRTSAARVRSGWLLNAGRWGVEASLIPATC